MVEIVQYLNLASLGAASLSLLVALLFIQRPRGYWKILVVGVGIAAILAPVIQLQTTLGQPNPWPPQGRYLLLGWKTVEEAGHIYVMVAHPDLDEPRQFQLPFDLGLALDLQQIRSDAHEQELICMQIDPEAQIGAQVELRRILARAMDLNFNCEKFWVD